MMAMLQKVTARGFFLLALVTTGVFFLLGAVDALLPQHLYTGWYALPLLAVLALLVYLLGRCGRTVSGKQLLIVSVTAFVLLIALQLVSADVFLQEPAWDPGGVFISAKEYVEQGKIITHEHYFDRFPNNCGLLAFEVLLFKMFRILGIPITMYAASLVNLLFTDVALLFMLLFVRKVWGNKKALLFVILSFCFTPFILYIPVVYSDTMSMVFITLPLYLFACMLKQHSWKLRLVQLLSISVLLLCGTKIKGSVGILLVALLFYLLTRWKLQRFLAALLVVLIPFAGLSYAFDAVMKRTGVVTSRQDEFRFPSEYWVYMGLQGKGGFLMEDFERVYAEPDYASKQQEAREGISERLAEYGIPGFLDHIVAKAKYTYGDGTYFAGVKLAKAPAKSTGLHEIFTSAGNQYLHYRSAANAFQVLLLLLLVLGLIRGIRKRRFDMEALLYLALFGLSLFLLIWETRSRYLINFAPLMLALMSKSLLDTGRDLRRLIGKMKGNKRQKINSNEGAETKD